MQIQYKECERNQRSLVLEVAAHRNTWSHQRQQRRQQKKYGTQQTSEGNNPCETFVSASADRGSDFKGSESILPDSPSQPQSQTDVMSMKRKGDEEYENNNKRLKEGEDKILQTANDLLGHANKTRDTGFPNEGIPQLTSQSELYSHSLKSGCIKMLQNLKGNDSASDRFEEDKDDNRPSENDCFARSSPDTLQKRDDITERNTTYLLNALVSVSKVGPDIIIEMVWLEGSHGRDAMHQVMQYIKNNLKIE